MTALFPLVAAATLVVGLGSFFIDAREHVVGASEADVRCRVAGESLVARFRAIEQGNHALDLIRAACVAPTHPAAAAARAQSQTIVTMQTIEWAFIRARAASLATKGVSRLTEAGRAGPSGPCAIPGRWRYDANDDERFQYFDQISGFRVWADASDTWWEYAHPKPRELP